MISKPPKKFRYPYLIGGPMRRQKAPRIPDDRTHVQFAILPDKYFAYSSSPAHYQTVNAREYRIEKVALGPKIVVEYLADQKLSGPESADALFHDMARRLKLERIDHDN